MHALLHQLRAGRGGSCFRQPWRRLQPGRFFNDAPMTF
jgi:hypothetical protein